MMPAPSQAAARPAGGLIGRHPAAAYFALTFAVSWAGALVVAAPRLLRGDHLDKFTGLMMFPVMLLGPAVSGILLTWRCSGAAGLRALLRRMARVRVRPRWYLALLIPPALVFAVLSAFAAVSPAYAPNRFLVGASFGLVAGMLEEIGWTGFAFPALLRRFRPLPAALVLGVLWSLWHLPVVDYLGAATPHGGWWLPYFLSFAAAMTAMRVVICWVYCNTGSVPMAQLLHASSTGALVVFSPAVTPAQECAWFGAYAVALWVVVGVVVRWRGLEAAGL
jgi:membrane protease YdiL (CAAX protease family)